MLYTDNDNLRMLNGVPGFDPLQCRAPRTGRCCFHHRGPEALDGPTRQNHDTAFYQLKKRWREKL